jgi:hypothetical protein
VQQLKERAEELERKKEEAVADNDFEAGRSYRDQQLAVRKDLEELYFRLWLDSKAARG